MRLITKISILGLLLLNLTIASGQSIFSLSTDFGVLRSFKKEQEFWAVGQTVSGQFGITPTQGLYAWIAYYTNGKYKNEVSAPARSPFTIPGNQNYTNRGSMNIKHFSVGWRQYLRGSNIALEKNNIYVNGGLGILFGTVTNTHSPQVDSALYQLPLLAGKEGFRRLTIDLSAGIEKHLGGEIFMYLEGKTFIPISTYPSRYFLNDKYAPLAASISMGFRISFNNPL